MVCDLNRNWFVKKDSDLTFNRREKKLASLHNLTFSVLALTNKTFLREKQNILQLTRRTNFLFNEAKTIFNYFLKKRKTDFF